MKEDLPNQLRRALDRAGVPAEPVVVPTPWDVGEVTAYLFADDPVTFVDSAIDTPESRSVLTAALAAHGLAPSDVKRVLVTHAHTDHFGGAIWLQKESSCEVLVHQADIQMATDPKRQETGRQIFSALGFSTAELERLFGDENHRWRVPQFSPLHEGDVFEIGEARLTIEHHPGHTPGHVWIVEEHSRAIFVGDYLISNHPTNAGLERDASRPSGRASLLQQYNAGLRELMQRDAPLLLPGHGPPIADYRDLVARRLRKTDRRTRNVLDGLRRSGRTTALALGQALYRDRMDTNWEVVADLVGRLDLLVAEGHASTRLGEDGVWYFEAI